VYNVPSTLLNDPDAKNENNQISAEKALTVRAAIPALIELRDGINIQMKVWGWNDIFLDFDLDCYPELQEDKLTQANFLDIFMGTLRQRYAAMDMEPDPNLSEEMLDTIFYKGQAVSEAGIMEPLADPLGITKPPKK
jgi:hypothetical protein